MAECGICGNDLPVRQDFKVYTYILRMSSIGGRSTLQVKNDRIFFQEHTYAICNSCYKKYGNIFPLIFWIAALLTQIRFYATLCRWDCSPHSCIQVN
jgi:hypothetical protein